MTPLMSSSRTGGRSARLSSRDMQRATAKAAAGASSASIDSSLPTATEPRRKSLRFPLHAAVAENRNLARATARLDALTDWERRPRSKMRVGLEPMEVALHQLGDSRKVLSLDPRRGNQGQGVGLGADRGCPGAGGATRWPLRLAACRAAWLSVSAQSGREIDEASLTRALDRALDAYGAAREARTPAAGATCFDLSPPPPFSFSLKRTASGRWSKRGLAGASIRPTSSTAKSPSSPTSNSSTPQFLDIPSGDRAREGRDPRTSRRVLVTSLGRKDEAGRVLQSRADELKSPVTPPASRRSGDDGATPMSRLRAPRLIGSARSATAPRALQGPAGQRRPDRRRDPRRRPPFRAP